MILENNETFAIGTNNPIVELCSTNGRLKPIHVEEDLVEVDANMMETGKLYSFWWQETPLLAVKNEDGTVNFFIEAAD